SSLMLKWMRLKDYRCFEAAEVPFHPGTTLLVGRNAQGKTSLLEAACLLMRLQSPRTSTRTDFIRFGAKACIVEGQWNEASLRVGQSSTVRRLAVDNVVTGRSGEYLKHTSRVVWMDHADMNLARGGAEHRRRYLDFAAAQLYPAYLPALRNYERALRSRNFLLKRDAVIPWRQVDAYSKLVATHGEMLAACRAELVERLQPHVRHAHHALSSGAEEGTLTYLRGYEGNHLEEELAQARSEEERSRSTARGPHRDDVLLEINGRAAGSFASEGQQRTLCLALKLAQARALQDGRGEPPLLLMDDIFGELDKTRRQALLAHLPSHAQKIITTTFVDWAGESGLDALIYEVEAGSVRPKMISASS
ncbi:MAG TPA: DNA replication and repair protein RecF, partial [Candidatus Saccharimonadia bacterium]|nr:DNA replication and repair protein RecF [Candidatus Saccharimonadia bacterium]